MADKIVTRILLAINPKGMRGVPAPTGMKFKGPLSVLETAAEERGGWLVAKNAENGETFDGFKLNLLEGGKKPGMMVATSVAKFDELIADLDIGDFESLSASVAKAAKKAGKATPAPAPSAKKKGGKPAPEVDLDEDEYSEVATEHKADYAVGDSVRVFDEDSESWSEPAEVEKRVKVSGELNVKVDGVNYELTHVRPADHETGAVGTHVMIKQDDVFYAGIITAVKKGKAEIVFPLEDGGVETHPLSAILGEPEPEDDEEEAPAKGKKGGKYAPVEEADEEDEEDEDGFDETIVKGSDVLVKIKGKQQPGKVVAINADRSGFKVKLDGGEAVVVSEDKLTLAAAPDDFDDFDSPSEDAVAVDGDDEGEITEEPFDLGAWIDATEDQEVQENLLGLTVAQRRRLGLALNAAIEAKKKK
jgi:hypothetical protein